MSGTSYYCGTLESSHSKIFELRIAWPSLRDGYTHNELVKHVLWLFISDCRDGSHQENFIMEDVLGIFANLDSLDLCWHIHMFLNCLKVAKYADGNVFASYSMLGCISSPMNFFRHVDLHACLTFNFKVKWIKFENNLIDSFVSLILTATSKHTNNIQQ